MRGSEQKTSSDNSFSFSMFNSKTKDVLAVLLHYRRQITEYLAGFIIGVLLFIVFQVFYVSYIRNDDLQIQNSLAVYDDHHSSHSDLTDRIVNLRRRLIKKPVDYHNSGIPKIIHQSWSTYAVPVNYKTWIQTWSKEYSDWHYIFWTSKGHNVWLNHNFKNISSLYNEYKLDSQKLDVRKYLTLYQHGGLFVDLEMERLVNIDEQLEKYPCIFAQDSSFDEVKSKKEIPMILNNFMACKPGHKFLKFLIGLLEKYQNLYPYDVVRSTGPLFLKDALEIYQQLNDETDTKNQVFIAPYEWFVSQKNSYTNVSLVDLCASDLSMVSSDAIHICNNLGSDQKDSSEKIFNKYYLSSTFDASTSKKDLLSIIDIVEEPFII